MHSLVILFMVFSDADLARLPPQLAYAFLVELLRSLDINLDIIIFKKDKVYGLNPLPISDDILVIYLDVPTCVVKPAPFFDFNLKYIKK